VDIDLQKICAHAEDIWGWSNPNYIKEEKRRNGALVYLNDKGADLVLKLSKVFSITSNKLNFYRPAIVQSIAATSDVALPLFHTLDGQSFVCEKSFVMSVSPRAVSINANTLRRLVSREEVFGTLMGLFHKSLEHLPREEMGGILHHPGYSLNERIFSDGDIRRLFDFIHPDAYELYLESLCFIEDFRVLKWHWIHGDFRPENLVLHHGRLLLIDFDNTSYFYRGYEIVRGFLSCSVGVKGDAHSRYLMFLRSYKKYCDLSNREKYIILYLYVWISLSNVARVFSEGSEWSDYYFKLMIGRFKILVELIRGENERAISDSGNTIQEKKFRGV